MELGHWQLQEGLQLSEKEPYGFIYLIECLANNKKYIGKKQCVRSVRRPPLKGKKRVRKDLVSSDWKEYTGSSNELNTDIEKFGKDQFRFTILEWGYSKFELGYKELKKQIEEEVLLRNDYYNGIIRVRLGKAPNYLKK